MLVLSINRILKWVQIISGNRRYTCPTQMIDGELCFFFKRNWHKVAEYTSEHTSELVEIDGKIIDRFVKK